MALGAIQRQRYLGAVLGGLAASALGDLALERGQLPEPELGGRGELLGEAEPAEVVVPEQRLAGLAEGNAGMGAALRIVREADRGDRATTALEADGLAEDLELAARAPSFEAALAAAAQLHGEREDGLAERLGVVGVMAGGRLGVQAIPSRLTTYLRHPAGGGLEELQRFAFDLLGLDAAPLADPDPATPPRRVDDEAALYASDWMGAAACDEDWAVLSLCRTGGELDGHRTRRSLYLVDQAGPEANLNPELVLDDALATIDAWLAEDPGRPVVVHCHAGASRTAFVLKAWGMERYGLSEAEAHDWLSASWPRIHRDNHRFVAMLRDREA